MKHPGVVIIRPDEERRIGWRARFDDPDTGRTVKASLDASLTTDESRRAWAARKSRSLAQRRLELEGGARRATNTALADAVETYFADHPTLRESTRELYRRHADALLGWAAREGVAKGDDLTRDRLVAFRASRLRVKRHASAEGPGTKGKKAETKEARAPSTVNVELRAVRAVLGYLRKLGLVSKLSSDDLRDGLERLETPTERLEYLKPTEIRKLLEASLRHDAETFTMTREDLAAGTKNTKPRYPAIAPFVAGLLLSGMRLDEGLSLQWDAIDLDALDHGGNRVGEIALTTRTKTKKPREIALEVSPGLRAILAAMKLRAGGKNAAGSVFGLTRGEARAAERRLCGTYGAPEFSWQMLRKSCGSYLSNAPAIFGSAAAFHSARQLGHSVQVAERCYIGRVRGIPPDSRDLESAMQIGEQVAAVVAAVGAARRTARDASAGALDGRRR